MTPQQFVAAHTFNIEGVNITGTINLHIEPNRDPALSSGQNNYTIIGCTIPIVPKNTQLSETQVINLLKQVEKITFTLTNNEQTEQVILEVLSKSENFGQNIHNFYYYVVKPTTITTTILNSFTQLPGNQFFEPIQTTETELNDFYKNISIIFEPFITDLQFGFSEFNATISNAINARTSTKVVESDRNTSTILPSNFNAIISGSATPAKIQDSIYQEVGWNNARYKGSKTTAQGYGNVPPTINGTEFLGEQYALNTSSSVITQAPYEARVIQNFFYSGDTRLPRLQFSQYDFGSGYSEIIGELEGTSTPIDSQTSRITVTIEYINRDVAVLKPGDVITASDVEIPFVVVKVEQQSITKDNIDIVGNYKNYATSGTIDANAQIRIFDPENRIYSFIGESSKIEGNSDAKIWIQEENEIAATNESGMIVYIQKP